MWVIEVCFCIFLWWCRVRRANPWLYTQFSPWSGLGIIMWGIELWSIMCKESTCLPLLPSSCSIFFPLFLLILVTILIHSFSLKLCALLRVEAQWWVHLSVRSLWPSDNFVWYSWAWGCQRKGHPVDTISGGNEHVLCIYTCSSDPGMQTSVLIMTVLVQGKASWHCSCMLDWVRNGAALVWCFSL